MSGKSSQKLMMVNMDPGIDDAQAVLMAFADPNVKILALCAHHGNTTIENATTNSLKLLTAIGRTDVPLYRGCERALVTQPPKGDNYFGKDGFGDFDGLPSPSDKLVRPEHGVLAMIRLVKEHPGQITLVGLGPLTNLAMAHRLDPEFSKNLKDCFIMGGSYKARGNITRCAEFNFYFDAEAAQVVLSEFQCPITVFTWELCLESAMPWDVNDKLRGMPGTKAKLMKNIESKLIDGWKRNGSYVICDELAMAGAMDEKCMEKWDQVSVEVECHGEMTRGQMVIDWNNKTKKRQNVRIVTRMNMDMVKSMLSRAFLEK